MIRAALPLVVTLSCFLAWLLFSASGQPATETLGREEQAAAVAKMGLEAPQQVRPPRMKKHYDFAGEEVPIQDGDIYERLDRELLTNTFYHSSTQHILKRQARYFAVIEPILREEGVPTDLKYIAVAESAFRDFRSPAGAEGIWHFMPATARQYGLEVNSEVDERYHIERATRAAARFLRDLHESLGSWTLAAAAYNRGQGGIATALREQKGRSYYDLNLNEETSRYVFRIVALKDILSDPTHYGFFLEAEDEYPLFAPTKTVTVSSSVSDWATFAAQHGVSYRQLKALNPWLREGKLTVKSKRYEVALPLDAE